MTVTIRKNDSNEKIEKAIQKVIKKRRKKSIDLNRYFGKVNFGVDGLKYQKKIRDEWN